MSNKDEIKRLRKGELIFMLSSLPSELKEYAENHPENKPYVEYFTKKYRYDFVKKKWIKNK